MHELGIISILLLGQVMPIGQFDAAPPAPWQGNPNVGQQLIHPTAENGLAHPDSSYVTPASATSPAPAVAADNSLSGREPLPLGRPGEPTLQANPSDRGPPSIGGTIVNIVSSLAIVLGLFFLVAWFMRRGSPSGAGALPSDVVQVLGRAALSPKQQMQLVRVGEKLVLVAAGATGVQTLTEVTQPEEVARLSAACEATRSGSASDSFRQVLSQLGSQPAVGGFFGRSESREDGRA